MLMPLKSTKPGPGGSGPLLLTPLELFDRLAALVLGDSSFAYRGIALDPAGVKVRFADPDTQLEAKETLQAKLGDGYTVALNRAATAFNQADESPRAADAAPCRAYPATRRG